MNRVQKNTSITGEIIKAALPESFIKLSPKYMIKNPVMFVVEIGFFITLLLTIFPALFGEAGDNLRLYNFIVSAVLLITILFANFAEAVAEGRGKAQAESLKKTQKSTMARRILPNNSEEMVSSNDIIKGDIVLVQKGETIPNDGEIIEGFAVVDESAINLD